MLDNRLTFGPYEAPPAHVEEEFGLLMSLALDDLLDDEEQATFDDYLARYPVLADDWAQWQQLDTQLFAMPAAPPPSDFLERFEVRLVQQERRRRLWWGTGFAAVVVLLSLGIVLGTVSFGAYVVLRQPQWLSELVHLLAYYSAAAATGVDALRNALAAVAGSEQARTFGLVYAVATAGLIGAWVLVLRRTTRMVQPTADHRRAA